MYRVVPMRAVLDTPETIITDKLHAHTHMPKVTDGPHAQTFPEHMGVPRLVVF